MADSKQIDPEPEDFAAAQATVGPLLAEESGSPAGGRMLYEAAQAHKLIRILKEMARCIPEGVRQRKMDRTVSLENAEARRRAGLCSGYSDSKRLMRPRSPR